MTQSTKTAQIDAELEQTEIVLEPDMILEYSQLSGLPQDIRIKIWNNKSNIFVQTLLPNSNCKKQKIWVFETHELVELETEFWSTEPVLQTDIYFLDGVVIYEPGCFKSE